jgi:hypothetical protein
MRKTLTYTVADEGRDKSKVFLITEMSAAEAEDWALQAFFAIMNAGIEIPDSIAEMGFAGIAAIGLKALGKVPFYMADPLLKKVMDCVTVIPDASKPSVVRALIDSDIEEAATRLKLKKAVFDLHTSFLKLAAP